MNNGFTVLLTILGIAVSGRAYAQDVAPGRPGVVEVVIIPVEARLTARSVEAHVFPEPLCEDLPEVKSEVKTWVAQVAPELASVRVRELPEKTALDVFGRAAAAGWGASISSLTPYSASRAPSVFPERHFAPWTRPSSWTS